MSSAGNVEINIIPKQVEGEVIDKKVTFDDVKESWANLVNVAKTAIEEAKQKQEAAREAVSRKVTVYDRGSVIKVGENTLVIEDMVITGSGQIRITGRLAGE